MKKTRASRNQTAAVDSRRAEPREKDVNQESRSVLLTSYPNSRLAIFEGPGRSIHTLFHLKLKREDEDRVEGRSERWTSKSIEGR